jgi:hypothetical protein
MEPAVLTGPEQRPSPVEWAGRPVSGAFRVAGTTSVDTRSRSGPVHWACGAPMVERCLGCSLGCSTNLLSGSGRL